MTQEVVVFKGDPNSDENRDTLAIDGYLFPLTKPVPVSDLPEALVKRLRGHSHFAVFTPATIGAKAGDPKPRAKAGEKK